MRLGEDWFTAFTGKAIVKHDVCPLSVVEEFDHVHPRGVDVENEQLRKKFRIVLDQRSDAAHEVTVSKAALVDMICFEESGSLL